MAEDKQLASLIEEMRATKTGVNALVAQGIESLTFWTDGLKVPFQIMNDAIKKYL